MLLERVLKMNFDTKTSGELKHYVYALLDPKKNKPSLLNVMQSSPWAKIELDISRSKDTGRDIEL